MNGFTLSSLWSLVFSYLQYFFFFFERSLTKAVINVYSKNIHIVWNIITI